MFIQCIGTQLPLESVLCQDFLKVHIDVLCFAVSWMFILWNARKSLLFLVKIGTSAELSLALSKSTEINQPI